VAIFAYSPAVWVYIKSLSQNQVYDVSADQVRGQTIHRSNAPHQMSVTLMNKNRRYDTLFAPNDLFVIYMKRTRRMMVMSGYLDSVPWYSTWERSVQLFGTCTMKRLLQKRWDPGTMAALDLMSSTGNTAQQLAVDGGMQAKALELITQVGGWPASTIHIAALPTSWAQKISTLYTAANPMLMSTIVGTTGGKVSLTTDNNPMVGSTQNAQSVPKNISAAQQIYFNLPAPAGDPITLVPYSGPTDIYDPTTDYYCQMNDWGFLAPGGASVRTLMKNWLAKQPPPGAGPVMIFSPNTNQTVLCEPVGTGPGPYNPNTMKVGVSPAAMTALGVTPAMISQGAVVYTAWCDQTIKGNHYPPGPWPTVTQTKKVGGQTKVSIKGAPVSGNPYSDVTTESSTQGQAAAAYALAVANAHKPYVWGATGPDGYDCSGLVYASWLSVGVQLPRESSEGYWSDPAVVKITDPNNLQPGDFVFYDNTGDTQASPNHMGIFYEVDGSGKDQTIQAQDSQLGINVVPMVPAYSGISIVGYGRPTGYPGWKGTTSSHIAGSGSIGTATSGNTNTSSATATGFASGTGVTTGTQTNTSFINYWEWFGQAPTAEGSILTGLRGLLNDQPLLPFVNTVLNSSMRSWCSAPNGDFIAWFPDYFGAYGSAASITVEDVELMDFSISWSDQNLVTHQYVASSWVSNVFGASPAGQPSLANITQGEGVVTLEMGSLSNNILQTVLNLKPGDASGFGNPRSILNRFGARSNFQQIGVIMGPEAQFWYALFLFQLNWASMWTASVPTTFMPEAYPGMLLRLTDGFQAYINQVTHAWDLTDGGPGFTTQMAIMAPSDWKNGGLFGLPKGGAQAVI
jgi:cell wall-associated NlpC family hydrolase